MELDKFKLESLDTAIVAILLLVPGFVMRAVTGQALDRKRAEAELQLVELVVRSLLCDAVLLAGLMLLGVIRSNKDIEDLSAARWATSGCCCSACSWCPYCSAAWRRC